MSREKPNRVRVMRPDTARIRGGSPHSEVIIIGCHECWKFPGATIFGYKPEIVGLHVFEVRCASKTEAWDGPCGRHQQTFWEGKCSKCFTTYRVLGETHTHEWEDFELAMREDAEAKEDSQC